MDDALWDEGDETASADATRQTAGAVRTGPLSWFLIGLGATLAAVAVGLFFSPVLFPRYTASALLAIEEPTSYIAAKDLSDSAGDRSDLQRQLDLIRSPLVLERLFARPKVASYLDAQESEDRIEHLRNNLSVQRIGESDLYAISYTSRSPQHSQEVANAVVAEYLIVQSKYDFDRSPKVIQLLENERQRRRHFVEDLKRKVQKLAKEVTGRDPFGFNKVLNTRLTHRLNGTTFSELCEADTDIALLEARLAALRGDSEATSTREQPEQQANVDDLQRKLATLMRRRAVLEEQFKREMEGIQSGRQKMVELTLADAELRRQERVLEILESRRARVTVRQLAALPTIPDSFRGPSPGAAVAAGLLAMAAASLVALAFLVRSPSR